MKSHKIVKAKKIKCFYCNGFGYTEHESIMGTTSKRQCDTCYGNKYLLRELTNKKEVL